jgi:RNA polymerase sigma-70 factor (sigma-E family)
MAGNSECEFHIFFERHRRELSRLACQIVGDAHIADDLAADALLEVWRHWPRVAAAENPAAYARGVVMNVCRGWVRRRIRERIASADWMALWRDGVERGVGGVDVGAVVDVRVALRALSLGRRACVVLRYGFDMSERDTADLLGISVGAVKSQTSRGAAQLAALLSR